MSKRIGAWFDNYHLVIVPVDATENPITRWRTDVISPSIMNERYGYGDFRARELFGVLDAYKSHEEVKVEKARDGTLLVVEDGEMTSVRHRVMGFSVASTGTITRW
ncbi:hypothetical protein E4U39_005021 [Claviceps sp. Clav50 group G5]|nr:hypothetical protein E4U39_005021 [Claviceps sp. Clav50 group G5]